MNVSNNRINTLIFDLDGTLVDSRQDIFEAVNQSRKILGLSVLSFDIIISYVGDGFKALLEKSFSDSIGNIDKAIEIYKDYYSNHLLDSTRLYPKISEMLEKFKGYNLSVISNKNEDWTLKTLQGLQIHNYFKDIIGGDTFSYKKPHPEAINHVIKKYGVNKENVVMIGDNYTDILAAKYAGVKSCFCQYGFGNPRGEKANWIVHNVQQIIDLFSTTTN